MGGKLTGSGVVVFSNDEKLIDSLTNIPEFGANAQPGSPGLSFASDATEITDHLGARICVYDMGLVDGDERQAGVDILHIKNSAASLDIILLGFREQLNKILESPRTKPYIARSVTKPVTASQLMMALNSVQTKGDTPASSERQKPKGLPLGISLVSAGALTVLAAAVFLFRGGDSTPTVDQSASIVAHEEAKESAETLSADELKDAREIERLLGLAHAALNAGNMVSPENENALHYFEQVLQIDVYHEHAYTKKREIISELRASFPSIIEDKDFDRARDFLAVLDRVEPFSGHNKRMEQDLAAALENQASDADPIVDVKNSGWSDVTSNDQQSDEPGSSRRNQAVQASTEQAKLKIVNEIDAALASGNLVPPKLNNAYGLLLQAVRQGAVDSSDLDSRRNNLAEALLVNARTAIADSDEQTVNNLVAYIQNLGDPDSTVVLLRNEMSQARRRAIRPTQTPVQTIANTVDTSKVSDEPTQQPISKVNSSAQLDAILPPKIIHRIEPDYPRRAYNLDIEGWVELEYRVNEEGRAIEIKVVDAEPKKVFGKSGVRALESWSFSPARHSVNGQPLTSQVMTTRFNFSMGN